MLSEGHMAKQRRKPQRTTHRSAQPQHRTAPDVLPFPLPPRMLAVCGFALLPEE